MTQIITNTLMLISLALLAGCATEYKAARDGQVGWTRWEKQAGGNGHYYKVVLMTNGVDWAEAAAGAAVEGGYLTTITSADENRFVFGLVNAPEFFAVGNGFGPALGGFQPRGSSEPRGGWRWVTGEPWGYTNWLPSQPDNNPGENYLEFCSDVRGRPAPTWNDIGSKERLTGYVMEREQSRRVAGTLVDPYFVETTNTVSKQGPRSITRNIMQDRKGNIWLASWEGVIRYDGKSFFNETLKNSLEKFHVFSLLEDRKGNIWIGTIRGGAYKYDGRKYTYYTTKDGLINNVIVCFAEDNDGNIWFGTDGGVSCFDGKRFRNYSMTDGLVDNSVNWIMQDKTGLLWFATRSGVSRFDGKSFSNFKTAEGKDFGNARTVIEDRAGNIWIGGNDGLIRYSDGKLETLMPNFIGYLYEDKSGNIWISSPQESNPKSGMSLSKYDGKTFEPVIDKSAGEFQMFGIYEDKVGNIWYGTERGASMLEKGKDRHVGGTRLNLALPR